MEIGVTVGGVAESHGSRREKKVRPGQGRGARRKCLGRMIRQSSSTDSMHCTTCAYSTQMPGMHHLTKDGYEEV